MLCLANQQEKGVVSGGYTASPTYIRQQFQPEICLLEAKTAFRKGAVGKSKAFLPSPSGKATGG